jgi:hypothetical protein
MTKRIDPTKLKPARVSMVPAQQQWIAALEQSKPLPEAISVEQLAPTAVGVAAPYAPRGPVLAGTSQTTATLVNSGTVTFTVNEWGLEFHSGTRLRATVNGGSNQWMEGVVSAFDPSTNRVTLALDSSSGTGTFSDWLINVAGQPGKDGASGPMGPAGATGPGGGRDRAKRGHRRDRRHRSNWYHRSCRSIRRGRRARRHRTERRNWHRWLCLHLVDQHRSK